MKGKLGIHSYHEAVPKRRSVESDLVFLNDIEPILVALRRQPNKVIEILYTDSQSQASGLVTKFNALLNAKGYWAVQRSFANEETGIREYRVYAGVGVENRPNAARKGSKQNAGHVG